MNTIATNNLVTTNAVVAMKADKTRPAPEVDQLLVELGNNGRAIPFLAIFPGDGSDPILLDGIISQTQVLAALNRAGRSLSNRSVQTTATLR